MPLMEPLNPEDDQVEPGFFLGRYRKAFVAFGSALLVWGGMVVASSESSVTSGEWIALGAGMLGVVTVAAVPNKG